MAKKTKIDTEEAADETSPELEAVRLNEEDLENSGLRELVDKGKEQGFLTYEDINSMLPDDISDPDGFGLIAAWECPAGGRNFALSLTGMEPTVVQIRFRTLLDSFDCG